MLIERGERVFGGRLPEVRLYLNTEFTVDPCPLAPQLVPRGCPGVEAIQIRYHLL